MFEGFLGAALEGAEVIQWIGSAEATGMDKAHEHIAQPGAVLRFVSQGVFAVQDGHFEAPLADVIVQGRASKAHEQGQGFPMIAHVVEGLTQP